jgi:hypothetical protein
MKSQLSNLENDCLALLSYIAKHPNFYQTTETLGAVLNMSHQRVSYLITSVDRFGPNDSVLHRTATKYGYMFKVMGEPGRILSVVYRGRTHQD